MRIEIERCQVQLAVDASLIPKIVELLFDRLFERAELTDCDAERRCSPRCLPWLFVHEHITIMMT